MKGLLFATDEKYVSFYEGFIKKTRPDARILYCKTASAANQILLREWVDWIIVDLTTETEHGMDTSGLDFLNGIRRIRGYFLVPVVFVCDLSDENGHFKRDLHCYEVFQKPLNQKSFQDKVGPMLLHADERNLMKDICALHYIKDRNKALHVMKEDEIIWFELHSHNGHIVTMDGVYDVPVEALRENKELLQSDQFIQANRSDYVHRRQIRTIEPTKLKLKTGDKEIPLTGIGWNKIKSLLKDTKRRRKK